MADKMRTDLVAQLLPWIQQFVAGIPCLGKQTRKDYRRSLVAFATCIEKPLVKKKCFPLGIKQRTIAAWLKEMRVDYSLHTVLTWVGTITRFLSFLEERGCLKENPLLLLRKEYPKGGMKGIVVALTGSSPQESLQAFKLPPRFTSPLGFSMQKFIALARSQGKLYRDEERMLCHFDRFLQSYSDSPRHLSDSILREWLSLFSNCQPAHRYKNFVVVRSFCLYLRRFDRKAYVPDPSLSPSRPSRLFPHIYSGDEIVALLKAARQLEPSAHAPLRPQILYIMILLLYTTGMRVGETLKLRLRDIDRKNQTLCIRETKFYKSRLVPLSPSMMKELEKYLQLRQRSGAPTNSEAPVFYNPQREEAYSRSVIEKPFCHMLRDLGLKPTRGRSGPRIHDLRHTMAVRRLENWYRRGVDVQSKLGLLSTYLGHVGIASTQRYLTMTTELLQQASRRFNQYFTSTLNKEGEPK